LTPVADFPFFAANPVGQFPFFVEETADFFLGFDQFFRPLD
jgi:hypothetical protein